jgi:hypothetical protein
VFSVTLSHGVQGGVNLDFATSDGTAAIADNDYEAANGTLSFSGTAGESQEIFVATTADVTVELDESIQLILSNVVPGGSGGGRIELQYARQPGNRRDSE